MELFLFHYRVRTFPVWKGMVWNYDCNFIVVRCLYMYTHNTDTQRTAYIRVTMILLFQSPVQAQRFLAPSFFPYAEPTINKHLGPAGAAV